jgi:hypothetical protein
MCIAAKCSRSFVYCVIILCVFWLPDVYCFTLCVCVCVCVCGVCVCVRARARVCVVLVIQHAMRVRHIVICGLPHSTISH